MRTCASIEGRADRDKFLLLALNKPGLRDLVQEENEFILRPPLRSAPWDTETSAPGRRTRPSGHPLPAPCLLPMYMYIYVCM